MKKPVPLAQPYFDSDEICELQKVLDSGWVSQGPKAKEFEEEVARYLGVKYAISTANSTSALHLANIAAGISPKDEVIVADFTFPATGHSVTYCGGKPRFCDVKPDTYNIDPEKIVEKITNRTKAIIPVHTFGQVAEMDVIMEIARDHELFVIEDAACALGSRFKGRYAGTFGDIGCFSFHARRKGITTGVGGMVVTDNEEIAGMIRSLSTFGMKSAWERTNEGSFSISSFPDPGYNYKMSDIAAAIGIAQMKKINRIIRKKRELAKHWDTQLDRMDHIVKPFCLEGDYHTYQSYVALIDRDLDRNSVIERLARHSVQTQIGTYSSCIQPVYRSKDQCPVSIDLYNRTLALPMYYNLKKEEITEIAGMLNTVLRVLS